MRNKKAQIGSLQGIVLTLVVIGLILGIGFLIFQEFIVLTNDYTTTIINDSIQLAVPADTRSFIYLKNNISTGDINCWDGASVILVTAYNNTALKELTTNAGQLNYTFNGTDGSIKNLTDWPGNVSGYNVTYSYVSGKEACGAIEDTVNATNKIPTWLSIIVILLIVGILLAIVFSVLPSSGGGGGFSFKGFGGGGSGGTTAEI